MRMIDEDELAWKKSQKTLDTSKRVHQNKTRNTGSAGKGIWSQLMPLLWLRTWKSASASTLRAPGGGVKCPGQVVPTTGSQILVPPQTQGGGVQSFWTYKNLAFYYLGNVYVQKFTTHTKYKMYYFILFTSLTLTKNGCYFCFDCSQ